MKTFIKVFAISCAVCFAASNLYAQVSVSLTVSTAPPALPVYEQPECPADGYIWQPGYWAYDDGDGYYWVPGVWVAQGSPSSSARPSPRMGSPLVLHQSRSRRGSQTQYENRMSYPSASH